MNSIFPVPSSPLNLSGTSDNSMSLSFMWDAPLNPNGMITHYAILCSGGGTTHVISITGSQTTGTLNSLQPYTNYSCSITAHTSVGGGPAATTSVTTLQDGESTSIDNPLLMSFFQFLVDHLKT